MGDQGPVRAPSDVSQGVDGIVRMVLSPGTECTLEVVKNVFDEVRKLGRGRPLPVLFDFGVFCSITREARMLTVEEGADVFVALAAVVDGPSSQMILAFFEGLNRPPFPLRAFKDEQTALLWLRRYVPDRVDAFD